MGKGLYRKFNNNEGEGQRDERVFRGSCLYLRVEQQEASDAQNLLLILAKETAG